MTLDAVLPALRSNLSHGRPGGRPSPALGWLRSNTAGRAREARLWLRRETEEDLMVGGLG